MPSLYETTAAVGDVSSSNFTTLYNSSGLSAPNTGGGAVGGNLNVAGNLTVQGTSLLQGAVTLGSTLSLPNYTFPSGDGGTDQVLTTDGSGNLIWRNVQTLPGAEYNISATTATGGANLTLANTAGDTDSVKFAGGTNITVSRTDANTITISTTADDIPSGTANGQMLVWENSAWTATNDVVWTDTTQRTAITGKAGINGRVNSALRLVNDTGATPYTTNDGTGILISLDSDSQAVSAYAALTGAYNSTNNHQFRFSTSKSSFSTDIATSITGGNTLVFSAPHGWSAGQNYTFVSVSANGLTTGTTYYVLASGLTATQAQVSLTLGGSPVALTNGTGLNLVFQDSERIITADQDIFNVAGKTLTLNSLGTGVAGVDSTIAFERGTSGADATFKWSETDQRFEVNQPFWAQGIISTDAESISMNADNTATDSYLNFKGFTQYLKWDNANQRFQLSDKLYISTDAIPPALFERRVVSSDVSANEGKSALRIFERVTDVANNNNDIGGPAMLFGRTYGASGGTERLFGSIAGIWHGTTTTADLNFAWSNDNFTETSPGVFPGSYTLLRLGSNNAEFFNNSLYVDYSTLGSTKVGINNDTPAYTLDVTGDGRITTNLTVNGSLTVNSGIVNTTNTTATLFNTTATTVNAFGAATAVNLGNSGGIVTVNGDLAVNGGDITTNVGAGGIANLYNSNAIGTINIGASVVTEVNIGNTSGSRVQIKSPTIVGANTTQAVFNTVATTVNAFGAATTVSIGANTGTTTINNDLVADNFDTTNIRATGYITAGYGGAAPTTLAANGDVTVGNDLTVTGNDIKSSTGLTAITLDNNNIVVAGDITVTGNDIKSSTGLTAITLDNNSIVVAGDITVNGQDIKSLGGTTAITLNGADIATGDITLNGGDIRSSGGTVAVSVSGANATVVGDLAVNGGDITTTQTTASVFNTTATTLNVGGAATTVNIGATTGGTIINNDLSIRPTSTSTLTVIGSISTLVTTQLNTTSTATSVVVSTTRSSMNGSVTVKDNVTNALHTVNFTALRNGATAMLTTYGELYTAAALATFTVDISGSDMRLLVTPASANSTTFNAVRTAIS